MEEKVRFVFEYERDEHSMAELCFRYGICRDTGYEWLRRFRLHGVKGLAELNRAARQHPNQTEAAMERAVLYNIYFADRKLVGFDSKHDKLVPLTNPAWPKDKSKNMPNKQKLSEICPV
jgi:leucine-zipper of insertion element IS481